MPFQRPFDSGGPSRTARATRHRTARSSRTSRARGSPCRPSLPSSRRRRSGTGTRPRSDPSRAPPRAVESRAALTRRRIPAFLTAAIGAACFALPASGAEAPARTDRAAIFYYPWYSTPVRDGRWAHWYVEHDGAPVLSTPYMPLRGLYSSSNARIVLAQMREIAATGVGTVVVSWWGFDSPEHDRLLAGRGGGDALRPRGGHPRRAVPGPHAGSSGRGHRAPASRRRLHRLLSLRRRTGIPPSPGARRSRRSPVCASSATRPSWDGRRRGVRRSLHVRRRDVERGALPAAVRTGARSRAAVCALGRAGVRRASRDASRGRSPAERRAHVRPHVEDGDPGRAPTSSRSRATTSGRRGRRSSPPASRSACRATRAHGARAASRRSARTWRASGARGRAAALGDGARRGSGCARSARSKESSRACGGRRPSAGPPGRGRGTPRVRARAAARAPRATHRRSRRGSELERTLGVVRFERLEHLRVRAALAELLDDTRDAWRSEELVEERRHGRRRAERRRTPTRRARRETPSRRECPAPGTSRRARRWRRRRPSRGRPSRSRAAICSSSTGVSARHGPHHAAQKSTTTGSSRERSTTSSSKVASVTSIAPTVARRRRRRLRSPRSARSARARARRSGASGARGRPRSPARSRAPASALRPPSPNACSSSVEKTPRRPVCRRAMPSSSRSSSNGSIRTFESEPMQIGMPRVRTRSAGRKPSPRSASVVGQAQIVAPCDATRSSSAPSAWVACTTVVCAVRQPVRASSSIGRQPCSARHSSISFGCSSAWTCSGRPCSAA